LGLCDTALPKLLWAVLVCKLTVIHNTARDNSLNFFDAYITTAEVDPEWSPLTVGRRCLDTAELTVRWLASRKDSAVNLLLVLPGDKMPSVVCHNSPHGGATELTVTVSCALSVTSPTRDASSIHTNLSTSLFIQPTRPLSIFFMSTVTTKHCGRIAVK